MASCYHFQRITLTMPVFLFSGGWAAMQVTDHSVSSMELDWRQERFEQLAPSCLYDILRLRHQVFGIEQDCFYEDLDGLDQSAHHLWCYRDAELLAYLRALPPVRPGEYSKLGRIVTAPAARGLGLGRELVACGIQYNFRQWPDSDIKISAQAHLQKFYSGFGFQVLGEVYLEIGIPHIDMQLAGS